MKSRSFLILLFLIFCTGIWAQKFHSDEIKIKKSEFKTNNKEGFKDAWYYVKEGLLLFEDGLGTFPDARDLFLQAHQYNNENPELNYLIGICYLYTDEKPEAIKYFVKAFDLKPKVNKDIHFVLGRAYHFNMEFDKAIGEYNTFLATISDEKSTIPSAVNKLIKECNDGKYVVENRKRVIIKNLGDSINSQYDDYGSFLSNNDSTIFFTSRRLGRKYKRNIYDNKFFEDIYTSKLIDGIWSNAVFLNKKINTSGNNAVVGISRDGSKLYVYEGEDDGGEIYVSDLKNGEWKTPESMPSRLSSDQIETSVFFSATEDTMYFISANSDLTLGGRDILFTVKNEKGKWERPRNIGSALNTPYDEEGIFVTLDGKEIFFSSKGHNTMGGYDIFSSRMKDDGTWSDPVNMGYPINSPDDDLFYSQSLNGKYGYYSTIRAGGLGVKDIYKITFLGSEKELMLENEAVSIAGVIDSTKKGFFNMPEPVGVDSFYYITGKVLDKKTNQPVVAKLEFIDVSESKIIATGMTTDSGVYNIKFEAPKQYGVEIIAKDYLFFLDAIDMTKVRADEPYVQDFYLEKIEVGTKVVLENIYFETGKAILTKASYPQLNQVVDFLKNNETVRLEISGHTDNVGSVKINTKLSDDRAKAVVQYFIANGINKLRLESKGYGFSQPIAPNNTAAGREQNRRVEFKVISK